MLLPLIFVQKKHFSRLVELYIILAIFFSVGLIWIVTRMTMRRQQKIFGDGSIRLNEEDDTSYFDDEVKLSHITFDDVSYNVGKLFDRWRHTFLQSSIILNTVLNRW
jgi:hypothetical protein